MEKGQLRQVPRLLDELLDSEIEHPDVAVTHESGWSLSCFPSGAIVLENVEDDDPRPRHLYCDRDLQLVAATAVSVGCFEQLDDWPWLAGYG
jgi:hypothetical protein